MVEVSLPPLSFPQLSPAPGPDSDHANVRGIVAVRTAFNFIIALFLLTVIFPGSDLPLFQKLSTYAYLIFTTIITYQSRSRRPGQLAATVHLIGFTLFTVGNAAFSLFASHQLSRGILWATWLPGLYFDRILARCRTTSSRRLLVSTGLLLVVAYVLWMLFGRPETADMLAIIPAAHIGSICILYFGSGAGRYFSKDLQRNRSSLSEARRIAERRISAERAATQAQLERVNRSLTMGALAASIAHEISQPLAAVVTNAGAAANWLHANQMDLAEARKAIERVVESGHRASEVITSFRNMLSGDEPQRNPVRLNELVEEALGIRAPEIQKSAVTILTPFLQPVPTILGDRVQLRQALLNLIANAIDATAEVIDRPRLLIIRCEEAENMCVAVSVEDNGPGLTTMDPVKIFEPFFSTKSKGMGMGLFISRMIVEAHGGSLKVDSRAGRTRFFLSIPTSHAYE